MANCNLDGILKFKNNKKWKSLALKNVYKNNIHHNKDPVKKGY